MDNDIVNEKELILLYGLRTARQKKRMQYKGFEQKLRALDAEKEELWMKQHKLGWIELDKPVMRGWKRFFVLRDDVAESIYATFFQSILDKINTVTVSNRKDFKVRKKRLRKWKYDVKKQELRRPSSWEFRKMGFSEVEQSFFEEKLVMNQLRMWVTVYVFKEPWRFVLKVRPNMITKTRRRDAEMESRYKELKNYFDRNHLEPTLSKIKSKYYQYGRWWEEERKKDVYEFKAKSLSQILDAIKQDD